MRGRVQKQNALLERVKENVFGSLLVDKFIKQPKGSVPGAEILSLIEKSFSGERNRTSRKLYDAYKAEDGRAILETIADNVIIVKNISGFLNKLLKEAQLIITEKEPFTFFESEYPEGSAHPFIHYIEDIRTARELENLIVESKKSDSRWLLGVGGGRTIDILKFVGFKSKTAMCAIPSSLTTHVYASPKIHCLPQIKQMGYRLTIDGPAPHLAILDLNLLTRLMKNKRRLIFSGFGDIMAFINAREDWKLAADRGRGAFSPVVDEFIDIVVKGLFDIDIERPLEDWIADYSLIQVLLCNITDWVGSAPASGAEHLFAKRVEEEVDETPLHGEMVALGALIFTCIRGGKHGDVVELMAKFGISTSFEKLGVNRQAVVNALVNSIKEGRSKNRYTIADELENNESFYARIIDGLIERRLLRD